MKKYLMTLLCVVLVAAVSIAGTVAFLTDRESVANTFTVGNVDITLDEADVNTDGTVIEGADRVTENKYHLIPGQTYTKDPTITVLKGSEESYVRMIVTLSHASELKAIFNSDAGKAAYPGGFLPQNHVTGWDADVWQSVSMTEDTENNSIVLEFRYKDKVSTVDSEEDVVLPALFKTFTLPGFITREQLATLVSKDADGNITSQFTITVEGHAIQAATFVNDAGEPDADAAWAAFDQQNATTNS